MIRSLKNLLSGIEADRKASQIGRSPVAPVYSQAAGGIRRPLTWAARIIQAKPYHLKNCCTNWDDVVWYYRWRGVWTNDEAGYAVMPSLRPYSIMGTLCFEERDWPNFYTVQQAEAPGSNGVTGSWAINIAEFDYDKRMGRGGGTGGTGPLCNGEEDCVVLMALGYFVDPRLCIFDPTNPSSTLLETKSSRYIPFFSMHQGQVHQAC